ncbi:hypothetical protein J3R82DRAFT_2585 [Butyriboletus roseoflavus]|nr:hypothetical protein J3R82DRAFT_2585 [Butyriboletus roseoflavus]
MLSQRVVCQPVWIRVRTLTGGRATCREQRNYQRNYELYQREANMYKSRLATAARSLQSSESSHKQTTAELQRTRTSLQALRATHVAELKKKEKEIERMVDKWIKLSDSQAKLPTTSPGMVIRGANAEVSSGMELIGKGKGLPGSRSGARRKLKNRTSRRDDPAETTDTRIRESLAHASFDHDALFPLTPINAADDKILSLFASANDAISILSKHLSDRPNATQVATSGQPTEADSEECKRLQAVIEKLQTELDEVNKLHETHATETRELLNQLAVQGMQKASMDDLMLASERDAERDRVDRIKKELEDEREKFTQAAVKLGKEKSTFESERIRFLEERRSWQVQQMLSEHPPAPEAPPPGAPPSPGLAAHLPEVKNSPRKSPRKQKVVGKSGNSRKTRVSRRSSIFSIPPPTNVEPAYETEVIPIVVSKQHTSNNPSTLTKSILPTSFVLPPLSPRTSFPPPDPLLGPSDNHVPESDPNFAERSSLRSSPPQPSLPNPIPTIIEPAPAPMQKLALVPAEPRTPPPSRRPFPMAKPLASHMMHAYSPVKPSPLSRILMLADSPESPESEPLPKSDGEETTPAGWPVPVAMGAAAGKDDDESPLREKKTERNTAQVKKVDKANTKKRTSKERSKVKEEPALPAATSKPKTIGAGEKENRDKPSRRGSPPMLGVPLTKPPRTSTTSKPEVQAKFTAKVPAKLPVGRGGARRVPIGSADAGPLPGWRG